MDKSPEEGGKYPATGSRPVAAGRHRLRRQDFPQFKIQPRHKIHVQANSLQSGGPDGVPRWAVFWKVVEGLSPSLRCWGTQWAGNEVSRRGEDGRGSGWGPEREQTHLLSDSRSTRRNDVGDSVLEQSGWVSSSRGAGSWMPLLLMSTGP